MIFLPLFDSSPGACLTFSHPKPSCRTESSATKNMFPPFSFQNKQQQTSQARTKILQRGSFHFKRYTLRLSEAGLDGKIQANAKLGTSMGFNGHVAPDGQYEAEGAGFRYVASFFGNCSTSVNGKVFFYKMGPLVTRYKWRCGAPP